LTPPPARLSRKSPFAPRATVSELFLTASAAAALSTNCLCSTDSSEKTLRLRDRTTGYRPKPLRVTASPLRSSGNSSLSSW
jgi:hypothetical protein